MRAGANAIIAHAAIAQPPAPPQRRCAFIVGLGRIRACLPFLKSIPEWT
jgi:hypothetical protein